MFTITALKKTSNSKVQFKSGNVTTILKVKVVDTIANTDGNADSRCVQG